MIDLRHLFENTDAHWHSTTIGRCRGGVLQARVMIDCAAPWHCHDDWDETFVVLSGSIYLDFAEGSHRVDAGHCLAVKAGVRHRARCEGRAELLVLGGDPAMKVSNDD